MLLLTQCENFPLTNKELDNLWQAVRATMHVPDDTVTIACVSAEEIQRLNRVYRNKNAVTNILSFSYASEGDHDIALCMAVARTQANERGMDLREYVALLVVHALLHVSGIDHDESKEQAKKMKELEREILHTCGFVSQALSDVY